MSKSCILFCLYSFLMSYKNHEFSAVTLYFHFPVLIFGFGLFIATIITYFIYKDDD